jgi:ABC-type transport system involved in multi-copper enzyme maturation permease subunit
MMTGVVVLVVGSIVTLIVAAFVCPEAYVIQIRGLIQGAADLILISPRRVYSLVKLQVKDAIRRKTLLVFVVFAMIFLLAGWFLSNVEADSGLQVRSYIAFVLTCISWLILPAVFLLSCWSLPEDIKARSLHTVVTKPVRRSEVLLGRMLGITFIGTVVLIGMGLVGYFWLQRSLPENVRREQMIARVPVRGALTWTDREGEPAKAGVNTGDIWEFRSYIEGNTKASAVWVFDDVTPKLGTVAAKGNSDVGLTLESDFLAFRTYKGDIETGVLGQLVLVNPVRNIRVPTAPFAVKEFRGNLHYIERKLTDDKGNEVDLFNDLVYGDGNKHQLRVEVYCLSSEQFLGMARPDLFIRAPDATFAGSYAKSLLGIWLMVVMLIVLAVTASTVVKGPVAAILVLTFVGISQAGHEFLLEITTKGFAGGGPVESVYRLVTHMNPTVPLEQTTAVSAMQFVDKGFTGVLWVAAHTIPDFHVYNRVTQMTSYGYDVEFKSVMLAALCLTLGYILPCFVLSYFCLQARELESK